MLQIVRAAGTFIAIVLCVSCSATPPRPTSRQMTSPSPSAAPAPAPAASPSPAPVQTIAAGPVPAGFVPLSTTWISTATGWVLGTAPCDSGTCGALLWTDSGGVSWSAINAPPTAVGMYAAQPGVRDVRFADPSDGWAFGPSLWSTHDGGRSWHQVTEIEEAFSLEATGGRAYLAAVVSGQSDLRIYSTAVGADDWQAAPITISVGAGPVPRARIVATNGAAWMIHVNRAVVGAARLTASGWQSWSLPCNPSGGPAVSAAASSTWIAVACEVGMYGERNPMRFFVSTDAGSNFRQTNPSLPFGSAVLAAPAPRSVFAGATSDAGSQILASHDSGASWQVVYTDGDGQFPFYVGFTTASQGVAIFSSGNGAGKLLMTFDAGRTWRPVSFR